MIKARQVFYDYKFIFSKQRFFKSPQTNFTAPIVYEQGKKKSGIFFNMVRPTP